MPPGPAGDASKPRAAVRDRMLADARSRRGGGRNTFPAPPNQPPRRFFDPAGEVARLHVGAPGDAERTQEIDALPFGAPSEGDASPRFLAQIQRILGFPLAFVSVVRGERTGYHAQIGMVEGAGRSRRRETTFCTHTVSSEAPLIVPNAAVEPFFRGSTMVQRERVKAYLGVPLRTSRGVIIGTVCVMDCVPRYIGAAHVRALDLFTEPIAAEIERQRRGGEGAWPRTTAGSPFHPEGWFDRLIRAATAVLDPGREPALVVASGAGAEALADLARDHEPAGALPRSEGSVGLLLIDEPRANAERFAELREALTSRARGAELTASAALRLAPLICGTEGIAKLFR